MENENAFIAVANKFIGQNENQTTITDLCKEMKKLCSTPYSAVYMKKRLQELLENRAIISNVQGKANVVTFNETSASILQTYHEKCKTPCDAEGEKERLIRTAVALIKSDMIDMCKSFSKEFFRDPNDLKSLDMMLDFLPDSLRLFLINKLEVDIDDEDISPTSCPPTSCQTKIWKNKIRHASQPFDYQCAISQ